MQYRDTESFESAVTQYSSMIYGIAYNGTHDRCDSEDIVQDVFLRMWVNRDRRFWESEEACGLTVSCEPCEAGLVIESERLSGLSPGECEVIRLHCIQGLSYGEITAILDISEAAARKRMSRARKVICEQVIAKPHLGYK
ncbi:DNA-directed RNA polymerase specialized sigma subunit, sigma24 family [Ruminococcaceae bacterium YRB3002]|nr:DNA-directed RNA polymerase specialized sigma subunit, sigma24 family [Ruminococcaceae bacterium YRB3002]